MFKNDVINLLSSGIQDTEVTSAQFDEITIKQESLDFPEVSN